jgi:hypothetical protein
MTKIIEFFEHSVIKTDWRTNYIRYRLGRLKHQYWLWNRKNPTQSLINEYDYKIIQNCQVGRTVFFSSSGYYLKDIFTKIDVIEMHPVVKTFYSDVYICEERANLATVYPYKADNFAVVNNRGDHWVDLAGLTNHFEHYLKIMNRGCRFFYSCRDTQLLGFNRLTDDLEKYFLDWAKSLEQSHNLKLVWHSIDFSRKLPDINGHYDLSENPDTTNGNLKFWFVYGENSWELVN